MYTSSPFSEYLSLDMREVPPGDPPSRPDLTNPPDNSDVQRKSKPEDPGMVWVIGPIIAALMLSICFMLVFIIKK